MSRSELYFFGAIIAVIAALAVMAAFLRSPTSACALHEVMIDGFCFPTTMNKG